MCEGEAGLDAAEKRDVADLVDVAVDANHEIGHLLYNHSSA